MNSKDDLEFLQSSFSGGMNLMDDDSFLADNEYREAFNVTNRYGALTPIKESLEIAQNVVGKKQGIYSVGNTIILFCAGKAYYRLVTSTVFQLILGFQMDVSAPRLNATVVPVSTVNLQRKLSTIDNDSLNINLLEDKVTPTPACMIVTDGISQPWILYVEGNKILARVTYNYDQWDNAITGVREYVPIGNEIMYHDGILFMVSQDRKTFYRSVTNRPLDFMVNVNGSGEKAPLEINGGAITTQYGVDYADITAMYPTEKDAFGNCQIIVATSSPQTYIVTINRQRTIYGEPTFNETKLFPSNAINNYCFVDILGDLAMIDSTGIRSFNAAKQNYVASNNDIFNLKIASATLDVVSKKPILQNPDQCAAINFDGFVFFSITTRHGSVIALYDTYNKSWSSFLKSEAINVKQFAHLLPLDYKLFAITSDDRVFELFGSEEILQGVCKTKRWSSNNIKEEQKIKELNTTILDTQSNGIITASGYVDNLFSCKCSKPLRIKPLVEEVDPAFAIVSDETSAPDNQLLWFNVRPRIGMKIGYTIVWTGGGKLSKLLHTSKIVNLQQAQSTTVKQVKV